jgi:hypothetical protein
MLGTLRRLGLIERLEILRTLGTLGRLGILEGL